MMAKLCRIICIFFAVACATMASAGQVANLYQADIAADADTAQWQQQALLQVLIRVSGNADIGSDTQLNAELKQASGYIKQFESVRHADGNRMRVLLDAAKVNQLLQANNIAVWGALRPDILVWQVKQHNAQREFVRRASEPLNTAMRSAFLQAGLPLLLPLYDMDDLQLLSETDVWAGFWQQIMQASERYRADVVLAVTVDSVMSEGVELQRLTWQRQDDGRTYRDEVTAADESKLMQRFAAVLAGQLAQRYASLMSADAETALLLQIEQLHNLSDMVQVQKLLQQVVGVSVVTVVSYDAGKVRYQMQSSVGAAGILNALRFNPQLRLRQPEQPQDAAELDASSMPALATFDYIRP